MTSRRDFLKMSAMTAASLALPTRQLIALGAGGIRPFQVPLAIPRVMQPVARGLNRDIYEVTMRKSRSEILPGKETRTWTFDGRFPGPTIKATRGREIVIRRTNALGVPVSTHLHGGQVPWRSDGHPSLVIAPGQTYEYVYPNIQDAATLWYHDHLCKGTSRTNYMGLSGLYIIDDDSERALNLPRGRYDIPLVLQDRSFKPDGSFDFTDKVDRVLGDVYLVNGRPMPYLKVANRKYRFRILNASNSRGYRLRLDSGEPLVQIGSDQGLLAAPTPQPFIPIWPAERVEVVIDFSKYPLGSRIVLQDLAGPADPASARPIMRFRVDRQEDDPSSLPPILRDIERLVPGPDVVQRELALRKNAAGKWVINGKKFDAGRIDMTPQLGDTEIWTLLNQSSATHPIHIHLVRFQILDRSNLQLDPGELGWKDTVRVDPAARVRVIMRFEGFTGRYMFHCHN
ncbi:MAG: multicopper oxidase domain-containing protein, partial [Actinomycetota bacterium]|nr:multicopper oxidase domain-containing protein [Actinomycetota bacterium]